MALVDLRSDLSWYSSNGQPRGFRPNADRQSTRYTQNEDSTFSVKPRGFDDTGFASQFSPLTSANEFYIDNNSTSFRGTSSRLNQLGQGTKFPTGPQGQEHRFDKPRTGFHFQNKYGDIYNSLTESGLAATYTLKSPIDDMYNKFKVREQVYNPYGDPAPPFILRGIQKDDSSDPERYGIVNSPVDIPRGGIVTATQRAALDVARLTKLLTRPNGLWWIAKQNTLHLMNVNKEGVEGNPQTPAYNANSTKVFTTFNLLGQIASGYTGLHNRKHGQFPFDTPGFLPFPPSPPSNYEDIIKERDLGITQAGASVSPIDNNRLVLTYRSLMRKADEGWFDGPGVGESIPTLTTSLGPTAISFDGTIGDTVIRRWSVTKPLNNREIPVADEFGKPGSLPFADLISKYIQWDFNKRYTDTVYFNDEENFQTPLTKYITDDRQGFKGNMLFVLAPNFADVNPGLLDSSGNPRLNTNYDDIQKANDLRNNAGPAFSKLVDFRSYKNLKENFVHESYDPYAKESDTGNAAGPSGRQEFLLTKLNEDGKQGEKFDGIGNSNRALFDNIPAGVDLRNPITGVPTSGSRIAEDEYSDIGKAAAERKDKKNTDIDFRNSSQGKYQEYKKDPDDEIGIARQTDNTDGINNTLKTFPQQNPALASNDTPIIAKYRTLAYDDIATIANKTATNKAFIHYNRKDESGKLSFWDGIATQFDTTLRKYNRAVTSDPDNDGIDLIRFKFNDITFRAYIDSISDSFSPGYNSEADQNRADPRYLYTSFERKINISFRVVYEHASNPPWPKLKKLADFTTPGYSDGPWGQGVFVTIGKLYNNVPMLIDSLSYDWDNETPWSLKGDQADNFDGMPMYTQVQVGLIYLGDIQPRKRKNYTIYGE